MSFPSPQASIQRVLGIKLISGANFISPLSKSGIYPLSSISPTLGNSPKTLTLYSSLSIPNFAMTDSTNFLLTIGLSSLLKCKQWNR
nr:MAG TPA: hypothetical protein [Caudoviricetes sp.]